MDPLNLICPNIIFPPLVSARFSPRQFSPALYYLNAWNRLNVGNFWWSWNFNDFMQLQKKKGIFVVVIHGLVALGAFTSKSCVGRERNVIKSVIHVQSCCFADKSNCFSTLSLSSASSLTVLCLLHDWNAIIYRNGNTTWIQLSWDSLFWLHNWSSISKRIRWLLSLDNGIPDTCHLCRRFRIDGIKVMSRGILGGKQVTKFVNMSS